MQRIAAIKSPWMSWWLFVFLVVGANSPEVLESKENSAKSGSQRHAEFKRFSTFRLNRSDLNKPVSPFNVFFQFLTAGGVHDWTITCVILRDQRISVSPEKLQDQLSKQLIPYSYTWIVRGRDGKVERRWLAYFPKNRDGTFHTILTLPQEELTRSQLEIYFEDIDGDGQREDVKFVVGLSDFDWTPSTQQVVQGTVK